MVGGVGGDGPEVNRISCDKAISIVLWQLQEGSILSVGHNLLPHDRQVLIELYKALQQSGLLLLLIVRLIIRSGYGEFDSLADCSRVIDGLVEH